MTIRKLGRKKAHRTHMLRNLAASVILYEKAQTTEAKAKAVRSLIERSVTLAKKNSLAARRQIEGMYFDSNVTKKLFDVLAPRFANRAGGYVRILHLEDRNGDSAASALISMMPEEKKEENKAEAPAKKQKASVKEKELDDAKAE